MQTDFQFSWQVIPLLHLPAGLLVVVFILLVYFVGK